MSEPRVWQAHLQNLLCVSCSVGRQGTASLLTPKSAGGSCSGKRHGQQAQRRDWCYSGIGLLFIGCRGSVMLDESILETCCTSTCSEQCRIVHFKIGREASSLFSALTTRRTRNKTAETKGHKKASVGDTYIHCLDGSDGIMGYRKSELIPWLTCYLCRFVSPRVCVRKEGPWSDHEAIRHSL